MVIVALITSVFLLAAALSGLVFPAFPYAVYTLMRVVVCVVCGAFATKIYSKKYHDHGAEAVGWVLIALAVIFNPIVPFALGKAVWFVIDIIAAMFIVGAAKILDAEDEH